MPPERAVAFGPGRVNLIGEHTDYNGGLALPFAIEEGVTVTASRRCDGEVRVLACDRQEEDRFPLAQPSPASGWRAFARGMVAQLRAAGHAIPAAELTIAGTVPEGSGLSSSAALEVALGLGLLALAGVTDPDRRELARLCSRVETEWVGAQTGLLDQLASLYGEAGHALRIDFASLEVRAVALALEDWRLVSLDSGEERSLSASGYNTRAAECAQARDRLGLERLSQARLEDAQRLPPPLDRRLRHVLEENDRVDSAVGALRCGDLERVGALLNASHTSLRDLYDASTDAVERTVQRCLQAGAAGARMVGGGFGGHVLALFGPGQDPPAEARELRPAPGARLVEGD